MSRYKPIDALCGHLRRSMSVGSRNCIGAAPQRLARACVTNQTAGLAPTAKLHVPCLKVSNERLSLWANEISNEPTVIRGTALKQKAKRFVVASAFVKAQRCSSFSQRHFPRYGSQFETQLAFRCLRLEHQSRGQLQLRRFHLSCICAHVPTQQRNVA